MAADRASPSRSRQTGHSPCGLGQWSATIRFAASPSSACTWDGSITAAVAGPRECVRRSPAADSPAACTGGRYPYEPLALTEGTPIQWPEDGAAVGVVARMDSIGVRIDEFAERVTSRSAHATEIDRLGLSPRGAYVLVIERTYYAAGRPVETADIVFPGDHYELVYRVPVD